VEAESASFFGLSIMARFESAMQTGGKYGHKNGREPNEARRSENPMYIG
jgi:hypothetical protein